MNPSDFIEKLDTYTSELREVLARFVHKHDSLNIANGDESRVHQIALELRDLFHDAMGANDYSMMVLNAYNEGITNYYQTPSFASVERIVSIVSAAKTRVHNNPNLLERPQQVVVASSVAPLAVPDKVSLKWLFSHVPYTMWLWLAGLIAAAFVAGAGAVYKLQLVQQWLGVTCTS